jgi:PAB-dependent poly(A)-specific ribonuclease subunit 3
VLPLDNDRARRRTTGSFGFLTSTFKVTSTLDGVTYALKRVDGINAPKAAVDRICANWQRVAAQASIVTLRSVQMCKAGPLPGAADSGSGMALFFEHDYVPGAVSLHQRVVLSGAEAPAVPEAALWSWASQLALGVSAAHTAGLAFRCLSPRHVIMSEFQRVRLAGGGVVDVLEMESPATLQSQQEGDMQALGQLLLQVACREELPQAHAATDASMQVLMQKCEEQYSAQWSALLRQLLHEQCSAAQLLAALAPSMATTLNRSLSLNDSLHGALGITHASSRLLRTIVKLSQVTERAEHGGDPSWAETGERYALKLFRDFVFHQVDEQGRPVLDAGHIVEALSRLDVADGTPVMLSSRDGENLLVASYATLARSLNSAYNDLATSQGGPSVDAMAAAAGEAARAARRRERTAMQNLHSTQGSKQAPVTNSLQFSMPSHPRHGGQVPHFQPMGLTSQMPSAGRGGFPNPADASAAIRFNANAPSFDG